MRFKRWLASKFRRAQKPTPKPSLPANSEMPVIKHVVLVSGHYTGGGATTYTGISENLFVSIVNSKIYQKFTNGESVFLFMRTQKDYSAYKRELARYLKGLGVDLSQTLVMKMHLNDATEGANGHEELVVDKASAIIARMFAKKFCDEFGLKLRRDEGLYWNPARGITAIKTCTALGCKTILVESFFCGYKSKYNTQFLEDVQHGTDKLASFWTARIREVLGA